MAAMLFVSTSVLNAENTFYEESDPYACFEIADNFANDVTCEVEEITGHAASYKEWNAIWNKLYDKCMEN